MVLTAETFRTALTRLGPVGQDDVAWSESVAEPASAEDFAAETIYVICNSGMKHTIARRIYEKVMVALWEGRSARNAFGHPGKAAAIDTIWGDRQRLFQSFLATPEAARVEWLAQLPWIGKITKYHLAKNFGVDCAKPDVHLVRLAKVGGEMPDTLCARLAAETGLRKATVDVVLWRACATGVLSSHTGQLAEKQTPAGPLFEIQPAK